MSTGTRPGAAALLRRLRGRVPHATPELRERLEVDRLRRAPVPDERHPWRQQVPSHPSLLDQVLSSALEPDYETVARRRAHGTGAGSAPDAPGATGGSVEGRVAGAGSWWRAPGRARLGSALVVAVFALLVAAAVRETRADAPTDALVRETLVREVTQRRAELDRLQSQVSETRRENGALSSELREARAASDEALTELRRLAATAGFQPVRGPGLRWTVHNAPASEGGALVTANELAYLVNGLWQAGAEAIAVNGERLTARSAITQSGAGINVNSTPLTAPFEVSVIGDPRTLESLLSETRSGYLWLLTVDTFGFRTQVERVDALPLPAAPESLLRTCGACAVADQQPPGQQPSPD